MVLKAETKTSLLSFDENEGFLRITSHPVEEIGLEDAKHDFWIAAEMVGNRRVAVMADSREYTHFSEEVREFYAGREAAERIVAMAIIISSLPTRLIGNFFIRFNKPLFPTRLFNSEQEATQWLKTFVNQQVEVQT